MWVFVESIDSQSSLLEGDNSRLRAKMHRVPLLTGGAQFFFFIFDQSLCFELLHHESPVEYGCITEETRYSEPPQSAGLMNVRKGGNIHFVSA